MEALDSLSRAADTSRGPGADVCGRHEGISLRRVPTVGFGEFLGIDTGLGCTHTTGRLECADGLSQLGVHQPVAGGHRRAVAQQWGVGDDHRLPALATDDDIEVARRLSAEQCGDEIVVSGDGGVLLAHFQNSNVCSTRCRKPPEALDVVACEAVLEALLAGNAVPVTGGAMVVEDTEPGGSSTAAEGETGGWSPGSPA
jgi:hypothetical protein